MHTLKVAITTKESVTATSAEGSGMTTSVVEAFRLHVTSVEKLMNFDRDVLDFAIAAIADLKIKLEKHHQLDNPSLTAERALTILQTYRKNDSLRPRYETIFNQALVLLVSYFGSAVHDLFRHGISGALVRDKDSALLREQVKLSFRELRDADFDLRDIAPDLLVQAKDISFQDMQSIARAFKEYLGISIERGDTVNEIIVAQACRHVIVHAGGVVSEKLIRQISGAAKRTLKLDLCAGKKVQFTVEEVSQTAVFMLKYLESVEKEVQLKNCTA